MRVENMLAEKKKQNQLDLEKKRAPFYFRFKSTIDGGRNILQWLILLFYKIISYGLNMK